MSSKFHVVVWGASGFTGRLVCEHLAAHYNGKVRWAMAGRNKEKLESVRLELAQQYGKDLSDTPILIGSTTDQPTIDAIAQQTACIISTAGPFIKCGTPLVEAAVREACHYVDITGEVPWVKHLIEKYHVDASKKGIRIINCCGYDSIPSDLGTLMVVDYMRKRFAALPTKVLTAVVEGKGGVSGGTIATFMNLLSGERSKATGRSTSTYALIPEGTKPGTDKDFLGTRFDDILKKHLAPFVMQVCNTRIVHRSNYLLGWGGGEFSYGEATAAGGWMSATAVAIGSAVVGAVFKQRWLHPLLRKMLPSPGEGPTKEQRENGMFKHSVVAVDEKNNHVVVGTVGDYHRDPGYFSTSRMVLEAGLALALQQAELDADEKVLKGGVITPASGIGQVLIDRLKRAGYVFEVEER